MRIVIDSNVLISALLWHGKPHALLDYARTGVIDLVLSQGLIGEIENVFHYPKFALILARTTRTPERILSELHTLTAIITAPPLPRPVCRDPDDDVVLACAIAAHAELIVSGDDDLLVLKSFAGIPIVNAAEALQIIATHQ